MCTGSMNASSFKYEKKTLPCFTCRDEDTYLRALPWDKPEGQWMRPMDKVKQDRCRIGGFMDEIKQDGCRINGWYKPVLKDLPCNQQEL